MGARKTLTNAKAIVEEFRKNGDSSTIQKRKKKKKKKRRKKMSIKKKTKDMKSKKYWI